MKNIRQKLKKCKEFMEIYEKFLVDPVGLHYHELVYILSLSITLLKAYYDKVDERSRNKEILRFSYYILLKYSISCKDYIPLYDFSINFGFYPISNKISNDRLVDFRSINTSIINDRVVSEFGRDGKVNTFEQNVAETRIMELSDENNISYVAPTSFGKSSFVIEHIKKQLLIRKKVAIIVPTKALLWQTYRNIKNGIRDRRVIVHDEMYSGEETFVDVLTQERALRLLGDSDLYFDVLYIDEAHKIFEIDKRSILITRLIKINRKRNKKSIVLYLSPVIENSNNLKIEEADRIFEQRIDFNVKEPDIFLWKNAKVFRYCRFLDSYVSFYDCQDMFSYILRSKKEKSYFYVNSPVKIEKFSINFIKHLEVISGDKDLDSLIQCIEHYVHKEFLVIECLRRGVVYVHGKLPEQIKEYLFYSFSKIKSIHSIVANTVILEGMNLPIDSLFILSSRMLNRNGNLVNLIGRVNRLDYIFGSTGSLDKLIPNVHFINNDLYDRVGGNMKNLCSSLSKKCTDEVKNPVLPVSSPTEANKLLLKNEEIFFSTPVDDISILRHKFLEFGLDVVYDSSEKILMECLLRRILDAKSGKIVFNGCIIQFIYDLFISNLDRFIIDDEVGRLKNAASLNYYKRFYSDRMKSLREKIDIQLRLFDRYLKSNRQFIYIGKEYGEVSYLVGKSNRSFNKVGKPVYIDLSKKSDKEKVNIAVVKVSLEGDFLKYKISMFVRLMFSYELITEDVYNDFIYGTSNEVAVRLARMGVNGMVLEKLISDKKIDCVKFDKFGNLYFTDSFKKYTEGLDDFLKFHMEKMF